jgi:hypothetical protein
MSKHTHGALIAAEKIVESVIRRGGISESDKPDASEMIAGIIDRETAAPELLESLKEMHALFVECVNGKLEDYVTRLAVAHNKATANIAKAEGRE